MNIEIAKDRALKIYRLARQAERSLDFALNTEQQWESLCHYYSDETRQAIRDIALSLRSKLSAIPHPHLRSYFATVRLIDFLNAPFAALFGRFRRSWRFTEAEIGFIVESLGTFLQLLQSTLKPAQTALIEARMNLFLCQHILSKRLLGVLELVAAKEVEHFCQPLHSQKATFEQIESKIP